MSDSDASSDLMRAVVKTGLGRDTIGVQSVPVPEAAPGFARVRVIATGICGTDIHIADDEYGNEPPVTMGHEVLGVVDRVGPDADPSIVGRRVALETYYSTCGECDCCRTGSVNLCAARRSIGSYENGGFAEYLTVPLHNLHTLPETVTGLDGVLSEPLACVAQCLLDPPIVEPGDRVLVTGPGAMGQLSAQVALASGADVTMAGLEKDRARLEVAASFGIRTTTGEPGEKQYDVVIECSGSAAAAGTALRAVTPRGRYVQVGIFGREVMLPMDLVLYKEVTVSSGFASTPASWRRAMELLASGSVRLAPLITGRFALEDWSEAFASVQAGEGIKTVIVPDPAGEGAVRQPADAAASGDDEGAAA